VSAALDTPATCPSCATENPARYRVCGACGAALGTASSITAPRRFVTIVTSDLKGSTALGEKLDPESLREVLSRYFDEMRLVFESHGGTIEKIIGDAIFTVFGLPVPAEDDALRAVEAAAESQRVLASLNDQLDEKWGVRLVNRTGVASGEVVVGQPKAGEHVLTGETLKIATTMEQNAPPFEVLVFESTVKLLRRGVRFEPIGVVSPKDGSGAYRALRLVAVPERTVVRGDADTVDGAAPEGVCQRCGEANDPGFRLCGFCGSPLATTARARESRKTVTIVFADPKPESLTGEPPTPEALRDAMAAYFEAMRVALERHGATIETFIGDAVMAVFGLPVRHEDDAIRAIRAAADMQAALPVLNEALRAQFGLEIGNHIGVNTGEVIAGDASLGQRLVTGDAVNTAARLEQAAEHGQIIVGPLTYRLAKDEIEVEAIEPLSLKGKAEPVPAYRFVRLRDRPVERARGLSPFVGREAEMGRLAAALDDATSTRKARLITIIGDAGVGKSRLIRQFASDAAGARLVRGRCLPYGDGITFWPISEIVREAAAIGADDAPAVARAKIAALYNPGPTATAERDDVAERVAAAIGLSATAFPVAELFWGIRRLLERLAAGGPLVAIIDDIHSAETTLLALLDHLLESVESAPILLLCSARHELFDRQPDWSEAHKDEHVVLQPLSNADSGLLIERLLGEAGLDETVQQRVVGAAEGNPLFVEQMVSMLVDDGVLQRDGERWVVAAGRADAIVVPPSIHALLAARLDNLAEAERDVVEPAAVVGVFFAQAAVEELVNEPIRPSVAVQLGSLSRKQFVRPEAAEGEPAFRFGHQLIRDTAYGSLLKRERAALHERFVTWAERINRERGREQEFEEILGYHLEQAYRYRGELGPIDEQGRLVGERAADKLGSAGRRASDRGDSSAAANLLDRATAVLPHDSRFRVELLAELGESLIALSKFEQATRVLDEGATIAQALADDALGARTLVVRLYADVFGSGGTSMADAIGLARGAVARLEGSGDNESLARAWRLIMLCDATVGHLEDASTAAGRVIEHATLAGDATLASRSASAIAYVLVHGPTPVPTAIERCRELLERIAGDRFNEAYVLNALAQLLAMNGEFEEARSAYARAGAIFDELGAKLEASTGSIESSRVELLAGELDAAEAQLRRDDAALEGLGERYFRSTIAGILANLLASRGQRDEALTYSQLAESLADEDDVWSQVAWRTARARVTADDPDGAVALATRAVELASGTEDIGLKADALDDLAKVLVAAGRGDESGPPRLEALTLYEQKGDRSSAARVRQRSEAEEPIPGRA
jgi:class 3 adenylate cyclase/tetratricopeptide (TPR) repeat protein